MTAAAVAIEASRTILLESRKSIELDLAELMGGGHLEIYPHVAEKGLLFVSFRQNKVTLAAGPFIGLIPLTPRITVDVRPKMPISNLARVLDLARSSLGTLPGVDRMYLATEELGSSVLEFLAGNFVEALKPLQVNGFHKDYLARTNVTSRPAGRIQIAQTLGQWARGRPHLMSVERFEQTSDTPLNRVLKEALRLILTRMEPTHDGARSLIKACNRALFDFPDTIGRLGPADVFECERLVAEKRLSANRAYYYRPIEIALLILSNRGVSLEAEGNDVLLETFIVNFEDVFEDYLRHVLQAAAVDRVLVQDGNEEGKRSLFDDRKEPRAQPDIVVRSLPPGKCVVAEVKYKDKPNRDDINQVLGYSLSFRTKRVILVHQRGANKPRGIQPVGTVDGVKVETYAYDLANADLVAEEKAFTDCFIGMVA